MSPQAIRKTLLALHILPACILVTLVYSNSLAQAEWFRDLAAFLGFPMLALTGMSMRFQGRISRAEGRGQFHLGRARA